MSLRRLFASFCIAVALTFTLVMWADEPPSPPVAPAPAPVPEAAVPEPAPAPAPSLPATEGGVPALPPLREIGRASPAVEAETGAAPAVEAPASSDEAKPAPRRRPTDAMVVFNRDGTLPAGSYVEALVSIGGSSTALGDVSDAVVSIMGDSKTEGDVGDAVVSIFGNSRVNGKAGTVVAVFGGIELGPKADVRDVVSIGGPIKRDPAAKVRGQSQEIGFMGDLPDFTGFRAWVRHALFLGRPLAIGDHLGWAWLIAAGFLAFYVLIAVLFAPGVERCVQTLQTRPGRTIVAALLATLLTPILSLILAVTVIGPFVAFIAVVVAVAFGKAALLSWMGRWVLIGMEPGSRAYAALSVVVGGALLSLLYLIPLFGFVFWKLAGTLALGMAVYTLILVSRRDRPARAGAVPAAAAAGFVAPGASVGAGDASTTVPLEPEAVPALRLPPTALTAALPKAGFGIRLAALAIDLLLFAIVTSTLSLGSFFLLLLATYGAVMWKLKGTTIGGIVFNLRVVRVDDRPVDWATSIVRALACFLSLFAAGLGFLWIAIDDDRQGWHDKIAGTVVVRVPPGTSLV